MRVLEYVAEIFVGWGGVRGIGVVGVRVEGPGGKVVAG